MIPTPSTIIENIEQLREYLQAAIQLEHATIPPYLTTAYTADYEKNKPSVDIITIVAKEEMLHLTMAANLLNAIGGCPDLKAPDFVPAYPAYLPTGQDDFDVGIVRFSSEAIETFLDIERPTSLQPEHGKVVQHIQKTVVLKGQRLDDSKLQNGQPFVPITKVGDAHYELHYDIAVIPHHELTAKRRIISEGGESLIPRVPSKPRMRAAGEPRQEEHIELHYWNIGEFYRAIHLGFVELTQKMGERELFCGDPARQIPPMKYWGGGQLMAITDLNSALAAVDLIAGQGEGSSNRVYDEGGELAHYYRFDQIRKQQYYRDPNKDGDGDEPGFPQGGIFPVDMDAVWPIKANAKVADYQGHPELMERALLFNGQYKRFLEKLHEAFNGKPEMLGQEFHREMRELGVTMCKLVRNPIPGTHEYAAPTFEMDHVKYPAGNPALVPVAADHT